MASVDDIEVCIPKGACIKYIPVECLPSSIVRKMGVRPSPRDLERSANGSSQIATWICPVQLREKKEPNSKTAKTHHFLTQGQFKVPVMSCNPTASRIFQNFLSSGKNILQAGEPVTLVSCSRVSGHGQNAMVLYDGQIFLSLQKKFLYGQSDSQNLALPVPEAQGDLFKAPSHSSPEQTPGAGMQLRVLNSSQQGAVLPPQISSHSVKQPQEEHKCGTDADCCSDNDPVSRFIDETQEKFSSDSWLDAGIRNTFHGQKKKRVEGQKDSDSRNNEKPMGGVTGCLSNEKHNTEKIDVCVHFNDEPMENCMNSDQQADGQLDVGDSDQSFRNKSHLKDVNMNTLNTKNFNAISRRISINIELQEDIGTEVENTVDGEVPFKTAEGCERFPAHKSDFDTFPVISHITSLAKGWNSDDGVMGEGLLCSSLEEPKAKGYCEFQDGALTSDVSAQGRAVEGHITPPKSSLQENGEAVLPRLSLNLENHRLDFKDLEREERISRLLNELRKNEAKLHKLSSH